MPQFDVDDDLVALVWQLAKPKPFEVLPFSAALRRVLQTHAALPVRSNDRDEFEELLLASSGGPRGGSKKAPSPSPAEWLATVPQFKGTRDLNSWKAICDLLKIKTGGDSARRKLKNWVATNHPEWPPVPEIDGDS